MQCSKVLLQFFNKPFVMVSKQSSIFCRITPVYLIIMMTYVCFYHYVGDSPLYPNSIGVADKCKQTWWHHILFVNNIIDNKGTAFEQVSAVSAYFFEFRTVSTQVSR